jgi:hypothetical protein
MARQVSKRKSVLKSVAGQPSWVVKSDRVQLNLTQLGGHIGPVTFTLPNGHKIQPYHVAPWAQEKLAPGIPPILRVLRGDFLCMPFGGNQQPWHGEQHPVHGETANARWQLMDQMTNEFGVGFHTQLQTKTRVGTVDKFIQLRHGHTAIYQEHVFTGYRGPMNVGHHAMLAFPVTPGAGLISTSAIRYGQVFPGELENPAEGGYQALQPGALFDTLDHVPTRIGEAADLSRYPARSGYEDLVLMAAEPMLNLAWTAVVFPKERYVWLGIKHPKQLAATILWHSNGGRHYAPWNGRHRNVLGLEEVTSYFHTGIADSAKPNHLNQHGIQTTITLSPKQPARLRYIMAVGQIPAGFNHVQEVVPEADDRIAVIARNGKVIKLAVDVRPILEAQTLVTGG